MSEFGFVGLMDYRILGSAQKTICHLDRRGEI